MLNIFQKSFYKFYVAQGKSLRRLFSAISITSMLVLTACSATNSGLDGKNFKAQGTDTSESSGPKSVSANANTTKNNCNYSRAGGKKHFVEFRSRNAMSYGHSFVVYGTLNTKGQIENSQVVGLHPAGDDPSNWMLGHIVPVISETGASDGDTEEIYVSNRHCVLLDEPQYNSMVSNIKRLQRDEGIWHAVFNNCNGFIGKIAVSIGMQAPNSGLFPADYIDQLKKINSN